PLQLLPGLAEQIPGVRCRGACVRPAAGELPPVPGRRPTGLVCGEAVACAGPAWSKGRLANATAQRTPRAVSSATWAGVTCAARRALRITPAGGQPRRAARSRAQRSALLKRRLPSRRASTTLPNRTHQPRPRPGSPPAAPAGRGAVAAGRTGRPRSPSTPGRWLCADQPLGGSLEASGHWGVPPQGWTLEAA